MTKTGKIVGTGVALAAAAAGTYFLTGKRGTKNRKKIASWTLKMKNELLEKMKGLEEINMKTYHGLVDKISAKYGRVEGVTASELKHLKEELKNSWKKIGQELK